MRIDLTKLSKLGTCVELSWPYLDVTFTGKGTDVEGGVAQVLKQAGLSPEQVRKLAQDVAHKAQGYQFANTLAECVVEKEEVPAAPCPVTEPPVEIKKSKAKLSRPVDLPCRDEVAEAGWGPDEVQEVKRPY